MKTTTATIAAILIATTVSAFSQGGPLTPPGPPAPTMKTLDQVEPRTPLVAGSPGVTIGASDEITITQPGSYYLTQNLDIAANVNGITINADGVTVDLMGHAIRYTGAGNANSAIAISGLASNVTIQNGHILSTTTHDGSSFTPGGFYYGVISTAVNSRGITLRNLSIRGVELTGIHLQGTAGLIENCSVIIANGFGIVSEATVRNCVVDRVGGTGISATTVQGCRVTNAGFIGILAQTVTDSSATSATTGISAQTVTDSFAISTGGNGIIASSSVTGSHGETTSTNQLHRGISAGSGVVTSSTGISSGGHGIIAEVVNSSRGISSGTHGSNSSGIQSVNVDRGTVTNSSGESIASGGGHGILASNVNGSNGRAATGALNGIDANLVTHSYGSRASTETGQYGIRATQANGSRAQQGEQITHKFNMP